MRVVRARSGTSVSSMSPASLSSCTHRENERESARESERTRESARVRERKRARVRESDREKQRVKEHQKAGTIECVLLP